MAVLIVYCLKDVGSDWLHIGLPKILAVAVVAGSYKYKHNTLISILAGTACYMVLLQVI
jgi:branched-subunit amino acid transport protein AzlD